MNKSVKILIVAGGLAILAGCGGKKDKTGGFRQVTVTRDDIEITVLSTGNVQPQNQLAIKPAISGRIEKILVKEGDNVKKGQVLMQLSSTERATLLDTARAQGPKALAHWSSLYNPTPLLSPEDGEIIYLPTVPGQVVGTSDSIMVMSDHLIVNTQVDETDLAQIKMDQDATITLDAYPDDEIEGTVKRISYQSTLVNNVTTYEVDVWPKTVPSYMRSGMTANVVFVTGGKDNVLVVPSEAIQQNPNGDPWVLKAPAVANGKPLTQVIKTGITDGKETEVVAGLSEDDKVLMKTFSAGSLAGQSTGTNPFMPGRPSGGARPAGGGGGGR